MTAPTVPNGTRSMSACHNESNFSPGLRCVPKTRRKWIELMSISWKFTEKDKKTIHHMSNRSLHLPPPTRSFSYLVIIRLIKFRGVFFCTFLLSHPLSLLSVCLEEQLLLAGSCNLSLWTRYRSCNFCKLVLSLAFMNALTLYFTETIRW